MTTATRKLTILQKSAAVEEAENTDLVRGTARKWKFAPLLTVNGAKII